jgi:transposase InsO family protein
MKLFSWKKQRSRSTRSESAPSPAKPQPHPRRARKAPPRKVVPLEIKRRALEALEAGLTAAEVGTLAGVSATAVERWRKLHQAGGEAALQGTARDPGTRKICAALEERITQLRREKPQAGVRKIRDALRREEGLAVSAETVRRVVNEAGLGNPPEPSPRRPPQVRRFERELPNALWQIDIFTFKLKRMYPVYLVGMIDDHSRYLVGHGLYRQQTAEAVLEVVKGAIGQWGAPREILSDNGRQFAAWRGQTPFQKVLQRQGIQHVRSAPHHSMTLGKIERFWKTLWTEFLADALFASFADARQRLDHWVGYYNHQRPHQGLDGLTPAERFYGVAGDVEEALKHGCQANALQLALGQEPQPPLYLLGKLGGTDVRIVRKGESIEVNLGNEVREVIRLGSPFTVDEQGHYRREDPNDAMEGIERAGAVPGGADGAEGGGPGPAVMPNLWREPANPERGDGESGPGGDGGAGAQAPGAEGPRSGEGRPDRGEEDDDGLGEGPGALEDEIRHCDDLRGITPEGARRGAAAGGRGGGGKKEAAEETDDCGGAWSGPERPTGGRQG